VDWQAIAPCERFAPVVNALWVVTTMAIVPWAKSATTMAMVRPVRSPKGFVAKMITVATGSVAVATNVVGTAVAPIVVGAVGAPV